ncbi:MAG TPA: glycogen debranching N-terminal domain-containing protein, partial [Nocardioides sp.]
MTTRPLQPLLHELSSCVAAPALLLCDRDGEIRPGGVSGWYVGDVRLADRLQLSVAGSALELVRSEEPGHDRQVFVYVARSLGDPIPDPTVVVERRRHLAEDRLEERIEVRSSATGPVEVELRLAVAGDVRPMAEVKQGLADPATTVPGDAAGWHAEAGRVRTSADGHWDGDAWVWRGTVDRATPLVATLTLAAGVDPLFGGGRPAAWSDRLAIDATDSRLAGTVRRSLDDLAGLLLADEGDRFLAAGSP